RAGAAAGGVEGVTGTAGEGGGPRQELAAVEGDVEVAATVGVLNAVEGGVAGAGDTRRKMQTADEAHGARREGRLVVAEESARAGQARRLVLLRRCRAPLEPEPDDVARPIYHGDRQGGKVDGRGGVLEQGGHLGGVETAARRSRAGTRIARIAGRGWWRRRVRPPDGLGGNGHGDPGQYRENDRRPAHQIFPFAGW